MNYFRHIEASLLRFCAQFGQGRGLTPLNMDDFTQESQWPADKDFIGFGELNLDITDFYDGEAAFMLSTLEDLGQSRLRGHLHDLLDLVAPNAAIDVVHADTGEKLGDLFIYDGVRVGPPVVTKTRPIRPVFFRFGSNLSR